MNPATLAACELFCEFLQIVGSVKDINYGAGCLIFICGTQVRGHWRAWLEHVDGYLVANLKDRLCQVYRPTWLKCIR